MDGSDKIYAEMKLEDIYRLFVLETERYIYFRKKLRTLEIRDVELSDEIGKIQKQLNGKNCDKILSDLLAIEPEMVSTERQFNELLGQLAESSKKLEKLHSIFIIKQNQQQIELNIFIVVVFLCICFVSASRKSLYCNTFS